MEKQKRFVSDDTLKALRNAGIIWSDKSVTITDCVVWFAKHNIAIITDYNRLDHEWTALACWCGRVPGMGEYRISQSYTDAMNAAIRDAAYEYIKQKAALK